MSRPEISVRMVASCRPHGESPGISSSVRSPRRASCMILSDAAPALGSADGSLFIAWRGSGNLQLNAAYSQDNGLTFTGNTIEEVPYFQAIPPIPDPSKTPKAFAISACRHVLLSSAPATR